MAGHVDWPNKFWLSHASFLSDQKLAGQTKVLLHTQKLVQLHCKMGKWGFAKYSIAVKSIRRDGCIFRLVYVVFPFYFSKPLIVMHKAAERACLNCVVMTAGNLNILWFNLFCNLRNKCEYICLFGHLFESLVLDQSEWLANRKFVGQMVILAGHCPLISHYFEPWLWLFCTNLSL